MRRRGLLGLPSALAAPLRLLVLLALLPVTRAIYTLEMFRQPVSYTHLRAHET